MTMEKNPFGAWIRLEQPRLGTRVTYASDEFFAAKERLIQPTEPVFIDGKYDDHGKWMDGWESRRRRTPGHDYCVIRLGVPGVIRGFDIDTRYFTGNYPPQASIDACSSDDDVPGEDWTEILPKTELQGDAQHFVEAASDEVWSHLRLNIYPDGGVARLRVYGEVKPVFDDADGIVNLLALRNGGRALAASDEHYGSMHNLNLPGRGVNMGDGWHSGIPGPSSGSRSTPRTSRATTRIACRSKRPCSQVMMKPLQRIVPGGPCCRNQSCRWTSNTTSKPNWRSSER
jgi:allantoicase